VLLMQLMVTGAKAYCMPVFSPVICLRGRIIMFMIITPDPREALKYLEWLLK